MSPRGVHCWHVELTSWIAACAFLSCFTLRFVTVSPFTINADRTRSQNLHGNLSAGIMDALLSGQRSCSCEPGAGMLNTLNIFSSVDSVDLKNVCYDPDGPERLCRPVESCSFIHCFDVASLCYSNVVCSWWMELHFLLGIEKVQDV